MKALTKFLLGAALAAGVVALLMSRRGTAVRDRLTEYAREAADLVGAPTLTRAGRGLSPSAQPIDDEAIRSKIEETRRRLHDQIEAQLASRADTAA